MKKLFLTIFTLLFCLGMSAQTVIYEFTLSSSTAAVGNYNATGGTADVIKSAFPTGGSNEFTDNGLTYFKFNSSTALKCTLSKGTFAAGDVITMMCGCSSDKTGKGVTVSGHAVTDNFTKNTGKALTYTITAGDGIDGTNNFTLMRNDSDIKLAKVTVTRGGSGGGGGSQTTTYTITYNNNGHGTAPATATGQTALPATLPTMSDNGWTFDGWYTDAALTTPAVAGATINANTTLYAKWTQTQGGGGQGSSTTGEDHCWNFSDAGWTAGAAKDGLTVGSGITFESNSKSIDDYSFTTRLKLGGTLSDTRFISFAVSGACSITVYGMSGSNGSTRMLTIKDGSGTVLTSTFLSNDGSVIGKDTYNYTGGATTITIGSTNSGYNLYGVCVSYGSSGQPASNDATLSDIQVDGRSIAGFSAASTSYNVTIPATQTTAPVVAATANHTAATVDITQALLPDPGQSTTASIIVTAEDGTSTRTYTITFTRADLSHDANLTDIKINGQSIAGFSASSTSYNVQVPYSTTTPVTITTTTSHAAATVAVTGYSTVEGTATITVTAEDGTTTKTYTITIAKAAPSTDATLSSLQYNGTNVPNFSATTLTYTIELPFGTTAVANVTATAHHNGANAQVTQPTAAAGTATVVVTAEDGTTTKTYTITFTVSTEPEWEEDHSFDGLNYNGESTIPAGYTPSSTNPPTVGTDANSVGGNAINLSAGGAASLTNGIPTKRFLSFELDTDCTVEVNLYSPSDAREFHICDENGQHLFAFTATTKNVQYNFKYKFTGITKKTKFYFYGQNSSNLLITRIEFSYNTRLHYIIGNDSTQNVLATTPIRPITYVAEDTHTPLSLSWTGATATGITLTQGNNDTVYVNGTAQCAPGEYHYILSTTNIKGKPVFLKGQFTVSTKITAQTDTIVEAFTGESMDDIHFRYYAADANDVTIEWQPSAPAGITTSVANGIYTITGIPTQTGTYTYTISVAGGNSLTGKVKVSTINLGNNPILYLYKNNLTYEKDGIYQYLSQQSSYNVVPRKTKSELRSADQYEPYSLILISEDVDANNGEVLAIARGEGQQKPVLNIKSFTYSPERLEWGEPDNGSLINREITVVRADHPIFNAMGKKTGDKIVLLDTIQTKGLMPTAVDYQGTLCLATAYTRGQAYMSNGEVETFLHEVPANLRGGAKYLCMPISIYSSSHLSAEGKRLLDACIGYLRGSASSVALPELQINAATIDGKPATIDQDNNEIRAIVKMDEQYDLEHMNCTFTLQDAMTHLTYVDYNGDKITIHLSGEVIDLSDTRNGVVVTVTDYINVRHYTLQIDFNTAVEEIYTVGEWVNIYDIQGRLVATTNEDLRSLSLPHGMYLIQTTQGVLKVMK